ncbi:MAG: hypothetical protein EA340_14655 [Nitriliruptor sp.]|nr:MAG: hypothetical protein EA340_14655 [Nitriliruptor sp.]
MPRGAIVALGRGRRAVGTIGTDADVVRRGTSADPTAPPPRRRLPWRSLLLVAVLVVLLSAIAGALSG